MFNHSTEATEAEKQRKFEVLPKSSIDKISSVQLQQHVKFTDPVRIVCYGQTAVGFSCLISSFQVASKIRALAK